jgi:catechol 2,3-dioxygenase-like lactoylglutathione lyase family enzyme
LPDHDAHAPPSPRPRSTRLHPTNIQFLRKQAKTLLRDYHRGEAGALARVAAAMPSLGAKWDGVPRADVNLAHAQFILARELGYASWPKLKLGITRGRSAPDASLNPSSGETKMTTATTPASANHLGLSAIDQIGLSCTDLDVAQNFYCNVLGLRYGGEIPGTAKFFDCNGVNLIMFKADKVPPNSVIYFKVEGVAGRIEQKVRQLRDAGVKIDEDARRIAENWHGYDVWLAFFRDPFGNLLSLKSDVAVGKA